MADAKAKQPHFKIKKPHNPFFKLKEIHMVMSWKFMGQTVCAICKAPLDQPATEQKAYGMLTDSKEEAAATTVAWGVCGHAFHLCCIQRYLAQRKANCPLCDVPWDYDRFEKIDNVGDAAAGAAAAASAGITSY